MGTVVVLDNATGKTIMFRDQDPGNVLDQGLRSNRFTPLREDGSPAAVYLFEGGVLIDGAPGNAWIDDVWYTGQRDILEPFYQSGEIIRPPEWIWNLPDVDPSAEILATYAAFKGTPEAQTLTEAYQTGGQGFNLQNPVVLAGIGVLFLIFISGGGRKTSQSAAGDLNL